MASVSKTLYMFNAGRLQRKDQSLMFVPTGRGGIETGHPKRIPIETTEEIFVMGALDLNAAVLNFLGQKQVAVHFFDYYRNYTGSFMPRDAQQAGAVSVAQVRHYLEPERRLFLARRFVRGGAAGMMNNLKYYANRGRAVRPAMEAIAPLIERLPELEAIPDLMGVEGNIRQLYYGALGEILPAAFAFGSRQRNPPGNPLNALISFGNSMCYTLCLRELHRTALNPTISFLHEPGARRFSLALDLAELFKPLITDRVIFEVVNKGRIKPGDFETLEGGGVLLSDGGSRTFLRAFDEKCAKTIRHRKLNRKVSYRGLVRLEAYKLVKHVMGIREYQPFRFWW